MKLRCQEISKYLIQLVSLIIRSPSSRHHYKFRNLRFDDTSRTTSARKRRTLAVCNGYRKRFRRIGCVTCFSSHTHSTQIMVQTYVMQTCGNLAWKAAVTCIPITSRKSNVCYRRRDDNGILVSLSLSFFAYVTSN